MISKFFLHNLPSFFKKTICILLIVLFVLTSLCGCQNEPTVSDRKKIPRVILSNAACSDFNNNVTPCGGSYTGQIITQELITACSDRKTFLDLIGPVYQFYGNKYGVKYPGLLACQPIWEQGLPSNSSPCFTSDNNMGGLKYPGSNSSMPNNPESGTTPTDGTGGTYAHFKNVSEYIEAHCWQISKYQESYLNKFTGNVKDYARALCARWVSGEDPANITQEFISNPISYSDDILSIYEEYNMSRYDSSTMSVYCGDSSSGSGSSGSEKVTEFPKYNLSDEQLTQLTRLAYQEQGTDKGAAAEASLMANLFETHYNSSYNGQTGADGLTSYVRNGGWFANSKSVMDGLLGNTRNPSEEQKGIIRSVLVNGRRTLPKYVDEHDCFSDIAYLSTGGEVTDRSAYIPHKTIVYQNGNIGGGGGHWIFYAFPDTGDPFGYLSEENREKYGEFCYDSPTTAEDNSDTKVEANPCSGVGNES